MDAKTMTMPNGDVINLKDDVARAKIGTGTLDTESKELIGAVNELKGTLDEKLKNSAVISGFIANNVSKTIQLDSSCAIVFVYRADTGLHAIISSYANNTDVMSGTLPTTITVTPDSQNSRITINNTAGFTIGITIISNKWISL